jgi:malate/lactate dehydrogenase
MAVKKVQVVGAGQIGSRTSLMSLGMTAYQGRFFK